MKGITTSAEFSYAIEEVHVEPSTNFVWNTLNRALRDNSEWKSLELWHTMYGCTSEG